MKEDVRIKSKTSPEKLVIWKLKQEEISLVFRLEFVFETKLKTMFKTKFKTMLRHVQNHVQSHVQNHVRKKNIANKDMSFLKITDTKKRDFIANVFLKKSQNIQQNFLSERVGDLSTQ